MTDDPKTDSDPTPEEAAAPAEEAAKPAEEDAAPAEEAAKPAEEAAKPAEEAAAPAEEAAKPAEEAAKPAEAAAKPAEAGAPAREEPASILPLVLVVGLVLVGLLAGKFLGGEQKPELTPEQLIMQGNSEPTAEAAIPFFQRAIELAPEHPQAHAALGRAYAMRNDFVPALEHLTFARDHSPTPVPGEVHLLIGMSYLGLEKLDEAIEPLETARKLMPNDYRPGYYLAMASVLLDHPQQTAEYLKGVLGHPRLPDPSVPYRWYVQAMDRLHRPDDAIAALTSLTTLRPADVRARYNLQRRFLDRDGFDATVKRARERAQAEKAQPLDRYMLAWLLSLDFRGRQEARQILESLRKEGVDSPWVVLTLANEDLRDNELEKARILLEEAVLAEPSFAEAQSKLAYVLRLQGQFDRAREIYEKQLRHGAAFVASQELLATYVEQGKLDEAMAFAKDRTKLQPLEHPSRILEAQVLMAKGDFDGALELLTRIRDGLPESDRFVWQVRRAVWALEAGRGDVAREAFEDVLASTKSQGARRPPDLLLWAGIAFYPKDLQRARALWQEAADSGREQDPEALFTFSARRLLGACDTETLQQAGALGGPIDTNDVWFVEGLARELAGDADGAREAYQKAKAATVGTERPARQIDAALARLK